MGKSIITVEGLSKKYRIGVKEESGRLSESLVQLAKAPLRYLKRIGKLLPEKEMIWGLAPLSSKVLE